MVGVVGSSPIAPTNILLNIKHPRGAFLLPEQINVDLIPFIVNSPLCVLTYHYQ